MPFKIRKKKVGQATKFQVVNTETGSVKGTHDTHIAATRQLRALYANVPEAKRG